MSRIYCIYIKKIQTKKKKKKKKTTTENRRHRSNIC